MRRIDLTQKFGPRRGEFATFLVLITLGLIGAAIALALLA
jgi:hypothetical protein